MGRLNPNFKAFSKPVVSLSGGQRQAVAIARAIHFNARSSSWTSRLRRSGLARPPRSAT